MDDEKWARDYSQITAKIVALEAQFLSAHAYWETLRATVPGAFLTSLTKEKAKALDERLKHAQRQRHDLLMEGYPL